MEGKGCISYDRREDSNSAKQGPHYGNHGAAWFLFAGGAALIAYLMIWGGEEGDDKGIDLFLTILPVAASIVSFWFAGRTQRDSGDGGGEAAGNETEPPQ
ncbi:MAG: hypothetical protein OXQ93_05610 [Gemmatimonadota bacterium]|nr:hypothetical protein [Gemmatimonadota bacterium]